MSESCICLPVLFTVPPSQAFAKKLSSVNLLQSLPFGLFSNTTTFGIYDSLPNDFSKVAVYPMRSFDYPTPQLACRRHSA